MGTLPFHCTFQFVNVMLLELAMMNAGWNMLSTMNLPEPLNCTVVPLSMKIPLSIAVAECRNTGQSTTRVKALFLAAAKAVCVPVVSSVVPVQDTQALMDLVFVVAAVVVVEPVPEVFEATVAVVELLDVVAAVVAAVVVAAVVVLAAVVVAAVVLAAVPVVVEVRVTLPLTEPVDVVAAVAAAVVLAAVVEAAVVAPVVADVPLDEPSLEPPPQPASARDMDNAQGRTSRFAARLAEASA
jgi:hypothetical protein